MSLVSNSDRLVVLLEEIAYAESQLQPHDTGHIHTSIAWMKQRVKTIKERLDGTADGSTDSEYQRPAVGG